MIGKLHDLSCITDLPPRSSSRPVRSSRSSRFGTGIPEQGDTSVKQGDMPAKKEDESAQKREISAQQSVMPNKQETSKISAKYGENSLNQRQTGPCAYSENHQGETGHTFHLRDQQRKTGESRAQQGPTVESRAQQGLTSESRDQQQLTGQSRAHQSQTGQSRAQQGQVPRSQQIRLRLGEWKQEMRRLNLFYRQGGINYIKSANLQIFMFFCEIVLHIKFVFCFPKGGICKHP